jgi:DNA transformation protein and related proteins
MAIDQEYLDYIIDQLSEFGDFQHKKMFGGIGFFRGKIFFAGIMNGVFRLKADETNIQDFEAHGMGPWKIEGRNMTMSYYEVPEEIVSDKMKMAEWAAKAFEVALRAKK